MSAETSQKKAKSEKKQEPDYLMDAIEAVAAFDRARLSKSEEEEKLKARAVKLIEQTNRLKGNGYISISKARTILQSLERRNKVEFSKNKQANS